jgi:hypothetical protein
MTPRIQISWFCQMSTMKAGLPPTALFQPIKTMNKDF